MPVDRFKKHLYYYHPYYHPYHYNYDYYLYNHHYNYDHNYDHNYDDDFFHIWNYRRRSRFIRKVN